MKRFWMATAAAALSMGTLVVGATPASAQDPIVNEYPTYKKCAGARLANMALFPHWDFYCEKGGVGGVTKWYLYRDL